MGRSRKAEMPALEYVGPAYHKGISVPGVQGLVRGNHMTPDEVKQFIAQHPEYSTWWTTPSATDHSKTESDGVIIDTAFGQMSVSPDLLKSLQTP